MLQELSGEKVYQGAVSKFQYWGSHAAATGVFLLIILLILFLKL